MLQEPPSAPIIAAAPPMPDGLRHVTDAMPGFTRRKRGRNFHYFDERGRRIDDPIKLARIKALGIPPAYKNVWICPHHNGHIQATGYDARGRKQYRYHTAWRAIRDETKFTRLLDFALALPALRREVARHISLPGLPRDKVLATIVCLLEKTLIRVGNAEYARDNNSYGLTTLQAQHVDIHGETIRFRFRGKSGKEWNLSTRDRRVANVIRRCIDLDGQELFAYLDENGTLRDIGSADVNDYLRRIAGDFTAKDFRTWSGTVLAHVHLIGMERAETKTQLRKNLTDAVKQVSRMLGNTPAICRKGYIHPEIMNAYLEGTLIMRKPTARQIGKHTGLRDDEICAYLFLKKRLKA